MLLIQNVVQYLRSTSLIPSRHVQLYVISGVIALVVDYSSFLVFYYALGFSSFISVPIGLTSGLIASFILNKFWTFRSVEKTGVRKGSKQLFLYLTLFGFNNLFTILLIDRGVASGFSAAYIKILTTLLITLWNYYLYKRVIFR